MLHSDRHGQTVPSFLALHNKAITYASTFPWHDFIRWYDCHVHNDRNIVKYWLYCKLIPGFMLQESDSTWPPDDELCSVSRTPGCTRPTSARWCLGQGVPKWNSCYDLFFVPLRCVKYTSLQIRLKRMVTFSQNKASLMRIIPHQHHSCEFQQEERESF